VLSGVVAGLVVQYQVAAHSGLNPLLLLGLTLAASVGGYIGAKVWYLAIEREVSWQKLREGLCIQGFIAGALLVLTLGIVLFHLPPGTVADDTAPALFFGIAVGRPGCFFTGCCAGRPTASRWGVWSSDRRIGSKRIPTQLWEAALGLGLGVATRSLLEALPFTPSAAKFSLHIGLSRDGPALVARQ